MARVRSLPGSPSAAAKAPTTTGSAGDSVLVTA